MNHSICVLHQDSDGNDYYSDVYNIVAEYLEKGYCVIYTAENNSPSKTIRNMAKMTAASRLTTSIDIEDYVKKGQLTVIDYGSLYYYRPSRDKKEGEGTRPHVDNSGNKTILTIHGLIKRLQSEIKNKKKKNNNYNKIAIIVPCKPFSERDDYDGLIYYENAINNELLLNSLSSLSSTSFSSSTPSTIECICCYRSSIIREISSLSVMISILLNHDCIITNNANNTIDPLSCRNNNNNDYKKTMMIIKSIRSNIDKILGNDTSNLILKTMQLIYHIDEEDIIRQPNLFVDKLVKVVGNNSANSILSSILEEIKKYLFYRQDSGR